MTAINGSAMKARGSAFERTVVRVLRAHGHPDAERAYGAGRPDDVGDVSGIAWAVVEVKCHRTLDLAGFMDEAAAESARVPGTVPMVVAKRRGKAAEEAYAVMRLADWAEMTKGL